MTPTAQAPAPCPIPVPAHTGGFRAGAKHAPGHCRRGKGLGGPCPRAGEALGRSCWPPTHASEPIPGGAPATPSGQVTTAG